MKLSDRQIWLIVIGVSTPIGVVMHSFFQFLILIGLLGFFIAAIIIVFILELVFKRIGLFRAIGFLVFFFLISTTFSWLTMQHKYQVQKKCSEQVIGALYNYFDMNKNYPNQISSLPLNTNTKEDFLKNQQYSITPSRQNFTISFNSDGSTTYIFNSTNKVWTFDGFEF